jgi:hypothetical protein
MVEAAVAGDPVEPRAHVELAVVCPHRVVGGSEHLLEDIFRVLLRAEHVATEREQARAIALEEELKGAVVPASNERDQALVRLESEQWRAADKQPAAGVPDCSFVHRDRFPAG